MPTEGVLDHVAISIKKLKLEPGDMLVVRVVDTDACAGRRDFHNWVSQFAQEVRKVVPKVVTIVLDSHLSLDHMPAEKVREFAGLPHQDVTWALADCVRLGIQIVKKDGQLQFPNHPDPRRYAGALGRRIEEHKDALLKLL